MKNGIEQRPVAVSDLLSLNVGTPDVPCLLHGIVLEHLDDIFEIDYHLEHKPGFSIFWVESNTLAYWDYSSLRSHIFEGSIKILCRPVEDNV